MDGITGTFRRAHWKVTINAFIRKVNLKMMAAFNYSYIYLAGDDIVNSVSQK